MTKHSLALSLFLIVVAASNFNLVASQPYTAFNSHSDLQTAVTAYCNGGAVDPKYGPIEDWDVSQVTSMYELFYDKGSCNPPIGNWDVSKVIDFDGMFWKATAFNQDISGWDVSSGTDFSAMFWQATAFNQDISGWDVSSGTRFNNMFNEATAFNQDISGWDVSSGTSFGLMFHEATSFDQRSIYCNWQSNRSFKFGYGVCSGGANCGWGETSCPVVLTPAPTSTPAPTTPSPTTPASDASNDGNVSPLMLAVQRFWSWVVSRFSLLFKRQNL